MVSDGKGSDWIPAIRTGACFSHRSALARHRVCKALGVKSSRAVETSEESVLFLLFAFPAVSPGLSFDHAAHVVFAGMVRLGFALGAISKHHPPQQLLFAIR